jgi:hypothetical protein
MSYELADANKLITHNDFVATEQEARSAYAFIAVCDSARTSVLFSHPCAA